MKMQIALLFLLLQTGFCFGQYEWTSGEIKLKNGEILTGQIRVPMNSGSYLSFNGNDKVFFRKEKKSKSKEVYKEEQVEEVSFTNSFGLKERMKYVPVSKNKMGLFIIKIEGEVTLYSRKVRLAGKTYQKGHSSGKLDVSKPVYHDENTPEEFYVLRETEDVLSPLITATKQKNSGFRKRAADYFSDCPELVKGLKEKKYNTFDVRKLVNIYNRCGK